MFDSLTERIAFDEQFVPNTSKDTLKRDLYERFITQSATADAVEDLLLKRRLLVKEDQQNRASVARVLMYHLQRKRSTEWQDTCI